MPRRVPILASLIASLALAGCADILGLDGVADLHLRGPATFDGNSAEADPLWGLPAGFRCDYPVTFWMEDGNWNTGGADIQWLRARVTITPVGTSVPSTLLYDAGALEDLLGSSPPWGEASMRTRDVPIVADQGPFSFSLVIEYYDRTENAEGRARLEGPGGETEIVCDDPGA